MEYKEKYEEWLNNPFFDEEVKKELLSIKENETEKVREPLLMVIPIVILTVIAVAGGVFSLTTTDILSSII